MPALKPGIYGFVDRRRVAAHAMGAAFVITLREAFQASLILGIVYTYLD